TGYEESPVCIEDIWRSEFENTGARQSTRRFLMGKHRRPRTVHYSRSSLPIRRMDVSDEQKRLVSVLEESAERLRYLCTIVQFVTLIAHSLGSATAHTDVASRVAQQSFSGEQRLFLGRGMLSSRIVFSISFLRLSFSIFVDARCSFGMAVGIINILQCMFLVTEEEKSSGIASTMCYLAEFLSMFLINAVSKTGVLFL
ncbi:hypothetical protein GW17_00057475, partial [Ensete ventricosum]